MFDIEFIKDVVDAYARLLIRAINSTKEGKKDVISLIDLLEQISELDKMDDEGVCYLEIANAIEWAVLDAEVLGSKQNPDKETHFIKKQIFNIKGTPFYYEDNSKDIQVIFKNRDIAVRHARWTDENGKVFE